MEKAKEYSLKDLIEDPKDKIQMLLADPFSILQFRGKTKILFLMTEDQFEILAQALEDSQKPVTIASFNQKKITPPPTKWKSHDSMDDLEKELKNLRI